MSFKRRKCIVPGCVSEDGTTKFKTPKDIDKRRELYTKLEIKAPLDQTSLVICSDHFDKRSIVRNGRTYKLLPNFVLKMDVSIFEKENALSNRNNKLGSLNDINDNIKEVLADKFAKGWKKHFDYLRNKIYLEKSRRNEKRSVMINELKEVSVVINDSYIMMNEFDWLNDGKIETWNDLILLMEYKENRAKSDSPASDEDSKDQIFSFNNFITDLKSSEHKTKWEEKWCLFEQPHGVCFYQLSCDEDFNDVKISSKLLIKRDLSVKMFKNGESVETKEFDWALRDSKLQACGQLWSILDFLSIFFKQKVKQEPMQEPVGTIFAESLELFERTDEAFLENVLQASIKVEPQDSDECSMDYEPAPKIKVSRKREKITEESTYLCDQCDKIFTRYKSFYQHYHSCHANVFFCDICGRKYTRRRSLISHIETHASVKPLEKCPHCDDKMIRGNLSRHIKTKHLGLKSYVCKYCDKRFTANFTMKDHMKKHIMYQNYGKLDSRPPKCFRASRKSKTYLKNCTNKNDRNIIYPCFICNRRFVTKHAAAEHLKLEHDYHIENSFNFCFECKMEFTDILNHSKTHRCQFVCQFCSLRMRSQKKLDEHISKRHKGGSEERPFRCNECPSAFKNNRHLQSHFAYRHMPEEEKKFVCEICNHRFGMRSLLNMHVNSNHSAPDKFKCTMCEKHFKFKKLRKKHYLNVHGLEVELNGEPK